MINEDPDSLFHTFLDIWWAIRVSTAKIVLPLVGLGAVIAVAVYLIWGE